MLGVRRPGVATAIHVLEGRKSIQATRGIITILNRNKIVGNTYGVAENEYERLMSLAGNEGRS